MFSKDSLSTASTNKIAKIMSDFVDAEMLVEEIVTPNMVSKLESDVTRQKKYGDKLAGLAKFGKSSKDSELKTIASQISQCILGVHQIVGKTSDDAEKVYKLLYDNAVYGIAVYLNKKDRQSMEDFLAAIKINPLHLGLQQ